MTETPRDVIDRCENIIANMAAMMKQTDNDDWEGVYHNGLQRERADIMFLAICEKRVAEAQLLWGVPDDQ